MLRTRLAPVVALATLLPAVAPAAERVVDRVAAIVNEDVIALSEVHDFLGDELERECLPPAVAACRSELIEEALETLVRRTLQRQELVKLKQDVTQDEVDSLIQDTVRNYGMPDREALREEVESQGYAWESYRRYHVEDFIREQKFAHVVLRSRVAISDEELRDQYQRLVREVGSPEVARIAAFGLEMPDGADARAEVVQRVRAALDAVRRGERAWADVVEELDTAGISPLFHGQSFRRDELAESLGQAIFETPVGSVTEPVVASGVLYGIRVEAREQQASADVPPFEEVKDRLAERVFMQKLERAADEWFLVAKRRAAIRYKVGAQAQAAPPVRAVEPAPAEK